MNKNRPGQTTTGPAMATKNASGSRLRGLQPAEITDPPKPNTARIRGLLYYSRKISYANTSPFSSTCSHSIQFDLLWVTPYTIMHLVYLENPRATRANCWHCSCSSCRSSSGSKSCSCCCHSGCATTHNCWTPPKGRTLRTRRLRRIHLPHHLHRYPVAEDTDAVKVFHFAIFNQHS